MGFFHTIFLSEIIGSERFSTACKAAPQFFCGAAFVKSGGFFIEWSSEGFRCKP